MNSSKLRRVAREAFVRLLVALAMAGIAVGVLGGSRWVVSNEVLPIIFFADLYGLVALLWLPSFTNLVLGLRQPESRAALAGAVGGAMLYQLLYGYGVYTGLVVGSAFVLPAVVMPRWLFALTGISLAVAVFWLVSVRVINSSNEVGLVAVALGTLPFFWYPTYRLARPSASAAKSIPTSLKALTALLVILASIELLGVTTSFLQMIFLPIDRGSWFHN